jgi:hypothetical protein
MDRLEFVRQLRATATELMPLTESATSGSLSWNGVGYTKSGKAAKPDPYALSWQTTLTVIADLLEAQESPMTQKQLGYLERLLFGGMGSLNDLFFDPNSLGNIAAAVNDRLDKQRRALFDSFKHIKAR